MSISDLTIKKKLPWSSFSTKKIKFMLRSKGHHFPLLSPPSPRWRLESVSVPALVRRCPTPGSSWQSLTVQERCFQRGFSSSEGKEDTTAVMSAFLSVSMFLSAARFTAGRVASRQERAVRLSVQSRQEARRKLKEVSRQRVVDKKDWDLEYHIRGLECLSKVQKSSILKK